MKRDRVSAAVVKRLPHYIRILEELEAEGITKVSSGLLSERTGYTASQIRQDLNHFGEFGQQGYGYNVADLKTEIEKIIGLDKTYSVVFVGGGRLGQAIANFIYSYHHNYNVTGIFDVNPSVIGKKIAGVKIRPSEELDDFAKENKIDIGVITVPKDQAAGTAKRLAQLGVSGIWNFAPVDVKEDGVKVSNVHIADNLQALTYYINDPEA